MRTRIAGGFFVLGLGICLFFVGRGLIQREERARSTEAAPAPAATTPPQSGNSGARPTLAPPPDREEFRAQSSSDPAFAMFADWTRRYQRAATPEAKAALEAEGVALAKTRLNALADLAQTNPERALELAVPHAVRRDLPPAVTANLEERVNTRADFNVVAVLPGPGSDLPPVIRYTTINGEDHQVYTFGDGLGFVTKANAPLNGIAVPAGAATRPPGNELLRPRRLLVLDPKPARLLEPSEVAQLNAARAQEPVCSTSGQGVASRGEETAVELGGEIHSFCGKVHAEDWANLHVAAEGLELPGGDPGATAESSYTEGRKRMLLLRPYWSDYAGMATNDAITHWVNFSNYMHQMSQGKLVFAPLGRGSDISTEIYLSGSVGDYSSGLGSAPSTWGAVRTAAAAAPYNYVLGDYDFVYYCTRGQPSASYAGLGFVGGVGFHLANSYFDAATSSHEFGHNLGLNHAHFWDTGGDTIIGSGQNVEYGDGNDPMGGGGNPNQYNSRYKNYLGWIPDSDIANLNATGSGVYRLYAFDLDNSVGLRGLRFTYSSSQNYWLNFRQRKSGKALQNGAQLLWTGNGNQGSYLLDVRLKGNADNNAIVIGRTFSDPARSFHATPVGKGNTYPESLDVRVNIGSFAGNLPPVLTVSSSPANPSPGAIVNLGATATDPDGDALAYFWDFGDGDYSVDNRAATTHTFAAAGEYAVQCTASDMKGGATRRTVIVRVGNPSTFRISGRVLDQTNRPLAGIRISTDTGRTVFTDSDGTYTIPGLAAGNYTLSGDETLTGALSFANPYFNNPVTVGPNFTTADFIGVTGSLNIYTPLSAKNSTWRYLDNGSNQGTAWRATNFNDSAWSTGTAPLGYPSGSPITTVVGFGGDSANKYITTYFRRAFVVPNPGAYTNLLLETLRDDGVVVYLNGTEVFRDNLPTGTINYLTTANDSFEPDSYLQTTLSSSLLVPGTNYLAAEVHQVEVTSSDIALDVALSGLSVSNATGLTMVYVSSPPDQSVFTGPTNVTVTATALSGGTVTNVEFYLDGVRAGNDTAAPYDFVLPNVAVGAHTLRVVASVGALRSTSAPISITVSAPVSTPPPVALTLISPGATWKYLNGPTSAPPTWANLNFNDTSWPPGAAPLGYGESGLGTTLSFGGNSNNKWITYYFRRAVTVPDPGAVTNLVVRMRRDDGGIVYVNGVEVFRSNITNGPVNYLTLASNAADEVTFFASDVPPGLLQPGTNVVAVEIHQSSITSSDLVFDLALEGLASTNRPRGVYLTAPSQGGTFSGAFTVAADAVAGGNLGVTKVEFFADDVKFGEDASAPFTLAWGNPLPGSHALTAVLTDTAGGTATSAPVNVTVLAPPAATALISFGGAWKYMDDGANPIATWTARTYNDSQWMSGPARLGYGGDGELTTVSYGTNLNNKHVTTYFRKAFAVANPSVFNNLLLRLVRDDGAVVYLNGTEIFRDNIQAGVVSWNSLATVTVDGAAEQAPVDVLLPTTGLLTGTNVVAVELHQASANSSDLGFDLSLAGLDDTNTAQGIYITTPGNGARFNQPANVAFASYAAAGEPVALVEYYNGAAKIGQAAAYPYAFTWAGAPAGSHVITARATYGAGLTLTSPPISIVVGPPPAPILPIFGTLLPPSASSWRYWDSTTNVAAGWQATSFNDTAWPLASARFGWGLDGEMTPLTEGRITHYFRRRFNISNGGQLGELLLYLVRDDGAVVYLNGVEVFRSNMPGGPIDASTLASAGVNTPDETTWYSVVLPTSGSGLLSSSNVIAVELHQSSSTSSDGSFDFALYAQGTTERRVYIGSPANNSSYMNSDAVLIEAFAWAGAGLGVTKVEYFTGTNKLGESTSSPYRFNWFGAPFGTHLLTARMTDTAGGTLDSVPVTVNITRELITTTFVPSNSVWKYLGTNTSQGTGWVSVAYNDSGWSSGPARLGFGGDGEVTLLPNVGGSSSRYPTIYFRRLFVVPAGAVYTNLLFKLARDDGAVVHLNGREAFRSNMPLGPITYSTLATNAADEQTFFPTIVTVTNLPPGTNILAVEVHQTSATSGDLGFNLELTASGYIEDTTPPLMAVELADGMIELSWPDTFSGWRAYGAPTVNTPLASWTPVPGTPVTAGGRHVHTVAPTDSQRYFRLGRP